MSQPLSVAITSARVYLNDTPGNVWTDAQLIPMAQEAHRELQARLWEVGSPVVRAISSPIAVTAAATSVTGPTDMLTPFAVKEFASTVETAKDAITMTEKTFIDPSELGAVTTKLNYWAWMNETIQLLGASVDRKVIVFYRRQITIPVLVTDLIGILFGELYIGSRVAAIGHGSLGNKDAYTILSQVAETNFTRVVNSQRGQQSPPMKP